MSGKCFEICETAYQRPQKTIIWFFGGETKTILGEKRLDGRTHRQV